MPPITRASTRRKTAASKEANARPRKNGSKGPAPQASSAEDGHELHEGGNIQSVVLRPSEPNVSQKGKEPQPLDEDAGISEVKGTGGDARTISKKRNSKRKKNLPKNSVPRADSVEDDQKLHGGGSTQSAVLKRPAEPNLRNNRKNKKRKESNKDDDVSEVAGDTVLKKEDSKEAKFEGEESSVCFLCNLAAELIITICKFLPPMDLFSFGRTCKTFYEYLNSMESQTTRDIWKRSRINHVRYLTLPPPEGMDERAYIRLALERGCQFCKVPNIRKVYWAFRVRCCKDCLVKRTISDYRIRKELRYNLDVVSGLPFTVSTFWSRYNCSSYEVKFFWIADVEAEYQEYSAITKKKERSLWVSEKSKQGSRIMQDVAEREKKEEEERKMRSEEREEVNERRRVDLELRLSELLDEKDSCLQQRYDADILRSLPSWQKAITRFVPLTDRSWTLLKKKLIQEYEDYREIFVD